MDTHAHDGRADRTHPYGIADTAASRPLVATPKEAMRPKHDHAPDSAEKDQLRQAVRRGDHQAMIAGASCARVYHEPLVPVATA